MITKFELLLEGAVVAELELVDKAVAIDGKISDLGLHLTFYSINLEQEFFSFVGKIV